MKNIAWNKINNFPKILKVTYLSGSLCRLERNLTGGVFSWDTRLMLLFSSSGGYVVLSKKQKPYYANQDWIAPRILKAWRQVTTIWMLIVTRKGLYYLWNKLEHTIRIPLTNGQPSVNNSAKNNFVNYFLLLTKVAKLFQLLFSSGSDLPVPYNDTLLKRSIGG